MANDVDGQYWNECPACDGTGHDDNHDLCEVCDGTGVTEVDPDQFEMSDLW